MFLKKLRKLDVELFYRITLVSCKQLACFWVMVEVCGLSLIVYEGCCGESGDNKGRTGFSNLGNCDSQDM